jgi:hypothetical protein
MRDWSHRQLSRSRPDPRVPWLVIAFVRAAWALFLLGGAARLLRSLGSPVTAAGIRVVRVLGIRHLLQAAAQAAGKGRGRVGALVDSLHGISMLVLATVDTKRRRAALVDAAVAGGFLRWEEAISISGHGGSG